MFLFSLQMVIIHNNKATVAFLAQLILLKELIL